jgi:spore maturation protein CgeB
MTAPLRIAFFGSSLVSAYWNGAATYYRGLLRALSRRGHHITFYEPDAYDRQRHRDMPDPVWARVVVYSAQGTDGVRRAIEQAQSADLVVKASGVGAFDELLENEIAGLSGPERMTAFWDVDAPATLDRLEYHPGDPLRRCVRQFDFIFTYGGGEPVVRAYTRLGARNCHPIYNALDPETHHRTSPDARFACTLAFLGNRLPDRDARVREFFFDPADQLPGEVFLLGGSGWQDAHGIPPSVRRIGHVYTHEHNALNSTARLVMNINRESMARYGHSPATRVFEAAGAAACLITDAWPGIEPFLEPDREILVAESGAQVLQYVRETTPARAEQIGRAAQRRIRGRHTYDHRAREVEEIVTGRTAARLVPGV